MKTIFSGKLFTIPNLLSFLRLLLIPWFVWTYVTKGDGQGTAAILILSGITDILDGYIARSFDMVSNLGKALDPVADKATQIVMIGCLTVRFPHTIYILIVLCIKELFVIITSLLAIHRTEEVLSADWHGKACCSRTCPAFCPICSSSSASVRSCSPGSSTVCGTSTSCAQKRRKRPMSNASKKAFVWSVKAMLLISILRLTP